MNNQKKKPSQDKQTSKSYSLSCFSQHLVQKDGSQDRKTPTQFQNLLLWLPCCYILQSPLCIAVARQPGAHHFPKSLALSFPRSYLGKMASRPGRHDSSPLSCHDMAESGCLVRKNSSFVSEAVCEVFQCKMQILSSQEWLGLIFSTWIQVKEALSSGWRWYQVSFREC